MSEGRTRRSRAEVLDDITVEARRQMADVGAAALSVRAVARELDMVSSGIYRYVASRDELLTMLIVACYDELGAVTEAAVAVEGAPLERWRAGCGAVRGWALEHPQDYALLYGSPVPGYAAPADTIGPAARVYAALLSPMDGLRSEVEMPSTLADDGAGVAAALGLDVDPATAVACVRACASLFGLISFELFGHTDNVIDDDERFFVLHVDRLAAEIGLAGCSRVERSLDGVGHLLSEETHRRGVAGRPAEEEPALEGGEEQRRQ